LLLANAQGIPYIGLEGGITRLRQRVPMSLGYFESIEKQTLKNNYCRRVQEDGLGADRFQDGGGASGTGLASQGAVSLYSTQPSHVITTVELPKRSFSAVPLIIAAARPPYLRLSPVKLGAWFDGVGTRE
jgi:hypothetical protein